MVTNLIGFGVNSRTPYSQTTSAATSGVGTGGNYTFVNRALVLTNNVEITHIGVYSTSAATISAKICNQDSTTQFDIVVNQSVSHGGTGWEDFALSSPYNVPASGTYNLGSWSTTALDSVSAARSYFADSDVTGNNQSGFTAGTGDTCVMRVSGFFL
jgi:hypothetical protein